jgi:hypothetical protein
MDRFWGNGQRALTSLSFKAFPLPLQSNPGTTAPKDRAVDVSGSKVSLPPAAVGIVCLSLPVQRATINERSTYPPDLKTIHAPSDE